MVARETNVDTYRFVQEADHNPGVLSDVVPRPWGRVLVVDLQSTNTCVRSDKSTCST